MAAKNIDLVQIVLSENKILFNVEIKILNYEISNNQFVTDKGLKDLQISNLFLRWMSNLHFELNFES